CCACCAAVLFLFPSCSSLVIIGEDGRSMRIMIERENVNEIRLIFPYDAKFVKRIKEIPQKRWVPERKLWILPIHPLVIARLQTACKGYSVLCDESLHSEFSAFGGWAKPVRKAKPYSWGDGPRKATIEQLR